MCVLVCVCENVKHITYIYTHKNNNGGGGGGGEIAITSFWERVCLVCVCHVMRILEYIYVEVNYRERELVERVCFSVCVCVYVFLNIYIC